MTLAATRKVVIVDLNNFARFPTHAVGLIVASLRNAGHEVQVISPLALDVEAFEREKQETVRDRLLRFANHMVLPVLTRTRNLARKHYKKWKNRPNPKVMAAIELGLKNQPDIILLSAYLQHRNYVESIAALAKANNVPLLLGGPVFNLPDVSSLWQKIPGVTATVGSEVDLELPDMVEVAVTGGDMSRFPGVFLPDGRKSQTAPPLRRMDEIPVPDYSDFPWERYPVRAIPVMTGRGCQWNRCKFCSDIISASGRTFRSRSTNVVLDELAIQADRLGAKNFIFLDLKLNSYPDVMRSITANIQSRVPGARWIGSVHVDQRKDNGLSQPELAAAFDAGMRRVSFGFESGSQRLLDEMDKGSNVERNSQFLKDGHAAGLSLRCTMFKGYPSETADDLLLTADFLEKHERYLDRVHFNDFSLMQDTLIYNELTADPARFPGFVVEGLETEHLGARYHSSKGAETSYRNANSRILDVVNAINSRPLREEARFLDGLM
jgi:anaerobic magnesium-protoporphyrin IX monomethyl ester cyclase